jgi:hypothetical protein
MALLLAAAFAIPTAASHSWNNYHWARTTSPFDLPVVKSVTQDWQFEFSESLTRWSLSEKLNNVVGAVADDNKTRKRCQMVNGQMRVCNAAYGQNGWLGMATINIDANGHITRGTVKVNDSYGWYFDANPGLDNHVMCQEIGHVYGLGHTSEDGSSQGTCMDYSSSLNSQWPNAHDYQQLDSIYAHLDSYNSYDDGSSGGDGDGGGGGCNAPPGKGCNKSGVPAGVPDGAIRVHHRPGRDGQLGHADFVLPDGRGGLWLWHVTLLPEDAQPR